MRLLIEPGDGVQSLVKGIAAAKSSVEIAIFRFDRAEIEHALAAAVSRGVAVHALIASTNRTGEENLRKLELRLLGAGVTVARSANDLIRYHGKMMIVDRRELYLLAFNLTHADTERSRSFGVVTTNREVVREAVRLFDADARRIPYEPALDRFVVSPANARKQLAALIQGAEKELFIYDPRVSDPAMLRLLEARAAAGVSVRLIGRISQPIPGVEARKLAGFRLHTRTMIVDGELAFVGSQSLRDAELDERREVGLIFRYPRITSRLLRTFESDWALAGQAARDAESESSSAKIARKVAKEVAKELSPVSAIVDGVVKEVAAEMSEVELLPGEVEEIVKGAVKEAVREAVRDAVEGAVENCADPSPKRSHSASAELK